MNLKKLFIVFSMFVLVFPLVSAGVGISWNKETSLVPENTKTCLTYKVYNPWPDDSYVEIELSEELLPIVSYVESETKFVPKNTPSSEAIPVEFCFKTPRIYEQDCLLFDKLICKQDCLEDMQIYSGEVIVLESNDYKSSGGSGGSATAISVSAPLKVKVQCVAHKRNYSLIYIVVVLIAGILLAINLLNKKRKKNKK